MSKYLWEDKQDNAMINEILSKLQFHYKQEHLLKAFLKEMAKYLRDEYRYTLLDFFNSDQTVYEDVYECYLDNKSPKEFVDDIMNLNEQSRKSKSYLIGLNHHITDV